MPLIAVEVKRPDEDVAEAFREARLYATELNAIFTHGTNPCQWVIATNGAATLVGHYDQAKPVFTLPYSEVTAIGDLFAAFREQCDRDALFKSARAAEVSIDAKARNKAN